MFVQLRNSVTTAVVAGALLWFAALAQADPVMILTKQDNGKAIILREGDVFQIELETSGGTGFTWNFDAFDTKHLEILGEETRDAAQEGMTGVPVTRVWRVRARSAGDTRVIMSYYRAWEGREKAAATFRLDVKIL